MQSCEDLVEGNVKKTVESGVYQQYLVEKAAQDLEDDKQAKRDEWRKKAAACKAAASKAGGEAQGRETKTKASFTNQYSDMFNFLFVFAILITTNFVYVKICILALKVYIHIGAALINRFFHYLVLGKMSATFLFGMYVSFLLNCLVDIFDGSEAKRAQHLA